MKDVTAADHAAVEAVMGQLDERGGRALAELAQSLIRQLPTMKLKGLEKSVAIAPVFFSTAEVRDAFDLAIGNGHVIAVTLRRGHGAIQPFKGVEGFSKFYDDLPRKLAPGQLGGGGWTNAAGEPIR